MGEKGFGLQVGLVGAGNMGQALIAGLMRTGISAAAVGFAEIDEARSTQLLERFPGLQRRSSAELASDSEVLVLAVKPQVMESVVTSLAPAVITGHPLVISVAAGISCAQLEGWLGARLPIVRAMPNTPALIGAGITGLYANAATAPDQRARADYLLSAVGQTVWIKEESLMHAVTATSGSGPAYVFLLLEAMQAAAEDLGLDAATARRLCIATVAGAAQLAGAENAEPPAVLRDRVTSPGGTTERALQVFLGADLPGLVHSALAAAAQRSRELAGE